MSRLYGVFQWTMADKWISLFDTPPEKNYLLDSQVCNTVMFSDGKVGFISDNRTIWFSDKVVYSVLAHLAHEGLPNPTDIEAYTSDTRASVVGFLEIDSELCSIHVDKVYGVKLVPESVEPLMALIKETNKESDYCGLM